MAKLKQTPIYKNDIKEYLNKYSDFSFEVKTLRKLVELGFGCHHGGTYEDPVTGKARQFDIRASRELNRDREVVIKLSFSVEVKNLRTNFPLVVHCMPRQKNESFIDLVWSRNLKSGIRLDPKSDHSERVTVVGDGCPYPEKEPVGKSCDQIGKRPSDGELIGSDQDVFDKISQSINASFDLITYAHYASDGNIDVISLVVPVLVIPAGTLWTIWYDNNGNIEQGPELASSIEYYINKSWLVGNERYEREKRYWLSHIEIVDIKGMRNLVEKYSNLDIVASIEALHEVRTENW